MNISISEALAAFAEEQVAQRGYATISEYLRELIRKDQERQALRKLLLAGGSRSATPQYDLLRERLERRVLPDRRAANQQPLSSQTQTGVLKTLGLT